MIKITDERDMQKEKKNKNTNKMKREKSKGVTQFIGKG